MKIVNDFACYFAIFLLLNITSLDAGLDGKSRPWSISISANQIMNLVVPSPCETKPYNKCKITTTSGLYTNLAMKASKDN